MNRLHNSFRFAPSFRGLEPQTAKNSTEVSVFIAMLFTWSVQNLYWMPIAYYATKTSSVSRVHKKKLSVKKDANKSCQM